MAADDHGEQSELLFQFAESTLLHGGRESGWDFERAEALPGAAASPVLDPNRPQHIRSLLTGEVIGFLFLNRAGDRLAFRWQTGWASPAGPWMRPGGSCAFRVVPVLPRHSLGRGLASRRWWRWPKLACNSDSPCYARSL